MTTQQPTAHERLADAARMLLGNVNPDPRVLESLVGHLEMSLKNYDVAMAAAQAAPFSAIVEGAIAQIDAGNPSDAKKFLLTLRAVVDFAPNVALAEVVKPSEAVWAPTHRHKAVGTPYRYLDEYLLQEGTAGPHPIVVIAEVEGGKLVPITLAVWHEWFAPVEAPADAEV